MKHTNRVKRNWHNAKSGMSLKQYARKKAALDKASREAQWLRGKRV